MKRFIAATLLALSLSACGNAILPADSAVRGAGTHEVKSFVTATKESFMADCARFDAECDDTYLSIRIVDGDVENSSNLLGICYRTVGQDQRGETVTLKSIKLRLDQLTAMDRNATGLVYHELAHCTAAAEHFDDETDLMGTFFSDFSSENMDKMIEKMFLRLRSR